MASWRPSDHPRLARFLHLSTPDALVSEAEAALVQSSGREVLASWVSSPLAPRWPDDHEGDHPFAWCFGNGLGRRANDVGRFEGDSAVRYDPPVAGVPLAGWVLIRTATPFQPWSYSGYGPPAARVPEPAFEFLREDRGVRSTYFVPKGFAWWSEAMERMPVNLPYL